MFDFDSSTGEVFLYDDIGPSWLGMIDTDSVASAIKGYDGKLTVRINSAGGSVDEAVAIYAMLERRGGVDVAIDSLAASAASYIAMVGETITIGESGMMMIHSPWTIAIGNAKEMRKQADILDKYEDRIATAYARRMSVTDEELAAILAEETWYTASEAVEAGLADSVQNYSVEPVAVAAGRFAKTPQDLLEPREAGSRTACKRNMLDLQLRIDRAKSRK